MNPIGIQEVTGSEAFDFIKRLSHVQGVDIGIPGFSLKGFVDIVCREKDQTVWEVHQPNLVSDYAKIAWAGNFINTSANYGIVTSPSSETPRSDRYSLGSLTGLDNVIKWNDAGVSSSLTNQVGSNMKTFNAVFPAPGTVRTIGTVGIGLWQAGLGVYNLVAYTLISPAKVQTSIQTLEVSYKLVLVPVTNAT